MAVFCETFKIFEAYGFIAEQALGAPGCRDYNLQKNGIPRCRATQDHVKKRIFQRALQCKFQIRHNGIMSDIFISYARDGKPQARQPEKSDAPIEIKIPQRMVNLPITPASILRKIALLVLTVTALVAGCYFYSFLQH